MSKLYACIISPDVSRDKTALIAVADRFAHAIETLDDGVLFDVSGLERLMGDEQTIEQKIVRELAKQNILARVAVAANAEAAMLLARRKSEIQTNEFVDLPLSDLDIERDTLNVFNDLGLYRVRDLLAVPHNELIKRYGREFEQIARTIRQKGDRLIVSNVKDDRVSWTYELDFAVHNFEQLIFVTGRGLDRLFAEIAHSGLSTEQIDITLTLRKNEAKTYEIKASFPSLEKSFWLKLVNLRIALDPPLSEIVSVKITAHFTLPRADQRGLYAVSRPEPESLLLTVNKLKKLVGEKEVGVPVLLNQRLAKPFTLNTNSGIAAGDFESLSEKHSFSARRKQNATAKSQTPIIAFTYFRPMIRASVTVSDGRLVHLKTRHFSGRVTEYSGVWRSGSRWWDRPWRRQEWDVEVENQGVYRLAKTRNEWFLIGEYD
jgi:protein ImuB